MKICHVNLASGFSGGEQQTLALIEQQLKNGCEISVVSNPNSAFTDRIKGLNCSYVTTTHFLKCHAKAITDGCNIIHVHEGKAVYWALIQHLKTGVPYMITRRIDNPLNNKFFLKMAYAKASHVVALSSAIKQAINQRLPNINVNIIPSSPIDYPSSDSEVEKIRQTHQDKFIVIQAAKLLKHKGHDVTIACAKMLEEKHPDIHFCILGDGPLDTQLKEQAKGFSNISFEGRQTDMGDWFKAADLMIHPAYSEGLGSVILEANQAGLAVIASRAGGIPDIITHEVNGLLIDPGEPKQLADALIRLKSDTNLLQQIKAAMPDNLKQFDIVHTAEQYQSLYTS